MCRAVSGSHIESARQRVLSNLMAGVLIGLIARSALTLETAVGEAALRDKNVSERIIQGRNAIGQIKHTTE